MKTISLIDLEITLRVIPLLKLYRCLLTFSEQGNLSSQIQSFGYLLCCVRIGS